MSVSIITIITTITVITTTTITVIITLIITTITIITDLNSPDVIPPSTDLSVFTTFIFIWPHKLNLEGCSVDLPPTLCLF